MTRRIVLTAMGVLVAAIAGCQTLGFGSPTSTPNFQGPSQLAPGSGSNPTASTAPSAMPSATPST